MQNWRRIELKEDELADNAVKGKDTFFLETGHAISGLSLTVRAKNETDHNAPTDTEAKTAILAVSNVKITAGTRTFVDASAEALLRLATYRNGVEPFTNLTQALGGTYPDGWQEINIPINFNRWEGDRECALPAPLYKDGGLRMAITYDFPVDDDAGANAFVTGAANKEYDLFANILPQMSDAQLKGLKVMEFTQKRTYTTKATGTDLIEMTTGGEGRKLMAYMISAYKTGVREGVLFKNLALLLNTTTTILENTWNGFQRMNALDCDLEFLRMVDMKAQGTDDTYYSTVPNVQPMYQPHATTSTGVHVTATGDQVTIDGQTADDKGTLFLSSPVIPSTVFMDFNLDRRLQNLLSMDQRKIQIKVTNGTADGAAEFHEFVLAPAILT